MTSSFFFLQRILFSTTSLFLSAFNSMDPKLLLLFSALIQTISESKHMSGWSPHSKYKMICFFLNDLRELSPSCAKLPRIHTHSLRWLTSGKASGCNLSEVILCPCSFQKECKQQPSYARTADRGSLTRGPVRRIWQMIWSRLRC